MSFAVNLLSVVPMRKEAAHRSEMVSQLLFGEYVEVLENEEYFTKVKCLYDGYEGWVQSNQLEPTEKVEDPHEFTCAFTSEVLKNGRAIKVPFGTPVYHLEKYNTSLAGKEIKYLIEPKELWNNKEYGFTEYNISTVYEMFLETPYLWGGKSVFGIDCSGFVQQTFKMFGIKLLRDAYLQATQGNPVADLDEAKAGDLAFFNNEQGRITHVGIILSNNQIVHASGKVRIDTIDKDGILNVDSKKRTHQLHSIRRFEF